MALDAGHRPPPALDPLPEAPVPGPALPDPRGLSRADYIRVMAAWLRLPPTTMATALVYYHRFDRFRKGAAAGTALPQRRPELREADTLLIATACVYLATKATDCPRKVRDVLNCAYRAANHTRNNLDVQSREYWRFRESLLAAESVLLRALRFDLTPELTFTHAIDYVRALWRLPSSAPLPCSAPAAPAAVRAVAQAAHALLSNAYLRGSVERFAAPDLALAAVVVALRASGVAVGGDTSVDAWFSNTCHAFCRDATHVQAALEWLIESHVAPRERPPPPPSARGSAASRARASPAPGTTPGRTPGRTPGTTPGSDRGSGEAPASPLRA